jgi:selenocysteine lyase/cysteine desulfurase
MMRELERRAYSGHSYRRGPHEKLAAFFNCSVDEIAITRNTTEGMNIVARSIPLEAGDEVIITDHEHIGGAAPWLALQKDKGIVVKLVKLDTSGETNLQRIKDSITSKTRVISFSHVTFTTGLVLPAKKIVDLCRESAIYSCIDGAQAVGMIPLDMADINPDFYVGSGHKWLFGPKGTGLLFINKSVTGACPPIFAGAYTDKQFDLRSLTLEYRMAAQRQEYGTRNVPIMVGLGTAIDFISSIGMENVDARGRELAQRFREGIAGTPNIHILTPEAAEYSTAMISIRVDGQTEVSKAAIKLDREKKLKVRGIFENEINAFRMSFSVFNSEEEVDFLVDTMKALAKA